MIITKRALPRRTVLRGLGTAMALPLLDSMVPAFTALALSHIRLLVRFTTFGRLGRPITVPVPQASMAVQVG